MSAPPSPVLLATAASGGPPGIELSELPCSTNTPEGVTRSVPLAAVVEEPAPEGTPDSPSKIRVSDIIVAEDGEARPPCDTATVSEPVAQNVDR